MRDARPSTSSHRHLAGHHVDPELHRVDRCADRRAPRRASQGDARGFQRWTSARHWCLERGQGGGERARKEAQSWPRQDKPRARAGKGDQLGNSKGEARARSAPRARTDCGEAAARSADCHSVERERMHRVMAWNANGLTLRDVRSDRLAPGRTKQMAETVQRQFAEALAAQLQENDAAGDEGDGSALKHRGDDKLEALIEYITSRKVAAIAISEVHGQPNNGRDLLDYLGMRLNWRAQRPAAKWKGVLPEYDPCFVYSAPDKDDHGGVLWGWDPNVMEKVEADQVYQGRVLRVRMRMRVRVHVRVRECVLDIFTRVRVVLCLRAY